MMSLDVIKNQILKDIIHHEISLKIFFTYFHGLPLKLQSIYRFAPSQVRSA